LNPGQAFGKRISKVIFKRHYNFSGLVNIPCPSNLHKQLETLAVERPREKIGFKARFFLNTLD